MVTQRQRRFRIHHGGTIAISMLLALVVRATPAPAQAPVTPDWDALSAEAARVLADYVRINTTNPPGNEIAAARFLKAILEREGIEAQILDTAELGPGRANLYARLRGSGKKKAIALVHHMDVVPAVASFWKVNPFAGEERDGYLWGRGTLDMKGQGVVHLMAMIAMKRAHVPLDRDIVFIANADEELGSTGAQQFVKRHADLLKDVEFLITEGGDNLVEHDTLKYYGVGVTEKRSFWQRLTVNGVASHGSRPTKVNPVPRLVAALDRIARYETPIHVTPGVGKYFRDISTLYPMPQRAWLANVATVMNDSTARAWVLSNVYWNAILRNTISLTGLHGSNKTNTIPAQASAEIDVRLLPDANAKDVLAILQGVVADSAVHFEQILDHVATPLQSPIDNAFFHAIERAAHERDPDVPVTTTMLTGGTDRPYYRALGIVTYGFDPFKVEFAQAQEGVHGNNERISLANLTFGVHYLYDVLRYAQ